MKTKNILFILLSFCIVPSFAQLGLITCSSERNLNNSVSIIANSQAYGDYTVKVMFTSLAGYITTSTLNRGVALATAQRGKKEIVKLTPDKSGSMYSYQYLYQYFPGRALPKAPDSSFVYLLPASAGNNLRISKVFSLEEGLGQKRQDEFYATGFVYKLSDTICASRGGVVYDCTEAEKEGEKTTDFFRRERNKIAIQHKDGSLGTYSVLAPIQLLVKPGNYVIPGQPLAVFIKESEKYQVLFSTYYLDEKKLLADNNSGNTSSPSYFVYMPMRFYAGEKDKSVSLQLNDDYAVQHPKAVIAAEISKREKKKLGFQ